MNVAMRMTKDDITTLSFMVRSYVVTHLSPDTKYISILLQHVQVKTRTVLLRLNIKLTGEK